LDGQKGSEEKRPESLSIPYLVEELLKSYEEHGMANLEQNLPSRQEVSEILDDLLGILFPGYFGLRGISRVDAEYMVGSAIHSAYRLLSNMVERCLRYRCEGGAPDGRDAAAEAERIASKLLSSLPRIRAMLAEDVQAAYDGDPAAKSIEEVIMSYPCIVAIATYRIAHELYLEGVPFLPRMLTERAHSLTGIDIHPGAKIGRSFFIDHGTGTVIGETTIIGDNVKLYQGVTLGALSFPRDEKGRIMKAGKRHPTIEDNVVIYSGATVLGGKTIIGRDSVIGGNCWIVSPVPPKTKVSVRAPHQRYRNSDGG